MANAEIERSSTVIKLQASASSHFLYVVGRERGPLDELETQRQHAGSLSRAIEQVIMCWAVSKAMVLVGIVFGSVAALLMPASCSLLSKHTPPWEQVSHLRASRALCLIVHTFAQ